MHSYRNVKYKRADAIHSLNNVLECTLHDALNFPQTLRLIRSVLRTSTFSVLKAYMLSYMVLQMAAIFFLSSLYLKQGIDSVYVMVDFICKG